MLSLYSSADRSVQQGWCVSFIFVLQSWWYSQGQIPAESRGLLAAHYSGSMEPRHSRVDTNICCIVSISSLFEINRMVKCRIFKPVNKADHKADISGFCDRFLPQCSPKMTKYSTNISLAPARLCDNENKNFQQELAVWYAYAHQRSITRPFLKFLWAGLSFTASRHPSLDLFSPNVHTYLLQNWVTYPVIWRYDALFGSRLFHCWVTNSVLGGRFVWWNEALVLAAPQTLSPMETAALGAGDKGAMWEEMADFRNIKRYCQASSDPITQKNNYVITFPK